jgi:hypothetical protein
LAKDPPICGRSVSQLGKGEWRYPTYVDGNMADDRSVMRKPDIFVFIVDTILACSILPVDLVINYESALYIDLDRSWVGRHASRSTSGIGVGGSLRCTNPVTTNLSRRRLCRGRHSFVDKGLAHTIASNRRQLLSLQ